MKIDPNAWMLTFSDLLTLLLTFFVMLISMSSFDTQKFRSYSKSLRDALVTGAGGGGVLGHTTRPKGGIELIKRRGKVSKFEVKKEYELARVSKRLKAAFSQVGNHRLIAIPYSALFVNGTLRIKPRAKALLGELASLLKTSNGDIEIRGFSNKNDRGKWKFSVEMAAQFLRFLLGEWGLDPARFSVAGYGDLPVGPFKGMGRRVEISYRFKTL